LLKAGGEGIRGEFAASGLFTFQSV